MAEEKIEKSTEQGVEESKPTCGIVMPISEIDGLLPSHWAEVLQLLIGSAENAGFTSKLVSESNFSGVIQQRIIENIYQNELVVCDVSGQNPNVMFELGLRLAFDKPTIVVVDDKTKISFDTSPIEHLIYPRDLRHGKIVDFTSRLTEMIIATYKESKKEGYTTFLGHFGTFDVKSLKEKKGGVDAYMLTLLQDLAKQVNQLKNSGQRNNNDISYLQQSIDTSSASKGLKILIPEALSKLAISAGTALENPKKIARVISQYIEKEYGRRYDIESVTSSLEDYLLI